MKKETTLLAIFALAAAGCASTASSPIIETRLAATKGQPIKTLVAKFGEPDFIRTLDAGHVYVWDGSSKTQHGFWTNFASCSLQFDVDKTETITAFYYSGTQSACAEYSDKLGNGF